MTLGQDTFFPLSVSINFTIKNLSAKRKIHVFGYPLYPGQSRNLLAIPEISESDIRHSLLKGELANFIRMGVVSVVSSDIDLVQFDAGQQTFLNNAGVTLGNAPIFGELSVTDNTSGQLMGAPNTYYLISQWTTVANAQGTAPSVANSNIIIPTAGWYFVSITMSATGTPANTFKLSMFQNGVIHPNARCQITMANTSPPVNAAAAISDINYFTANTTLDLRVTSASAGVTFTLSQANFNLFALR